VHVHGHYRVDRPEQRARLNPPWGFERILPCSDNRNATLDGVDFLNPSRPKDLRGWEPFLDNRAPIYMRHGEPIRRVWATHRFTTFPRNPWAFSTIFDGALGEAERTQAEFRQFARAEAGRATRFIPGIWAGWAHWIDGEPRLSFFTGSMALGLSAPTTMSFKIPAGQYWEMLELMADDVGLTGAARKDLARVRHDALLREAGFSRALPSARCMRANIRWLARAEADMRLTANTDGFVLLFPSSLFPTVQAYGLPGLQPEADGTILVVFSVPLSNLVQQERADGAAPVALRFRVSALDSTTGRRLWRDTTRLFDLTGHPEQNSHLSGYLEMNAPPGTYAVRVAIHQPDSLAGNAVDLLTPVVTWALGSALELSDPVTGRHDDNTLYWFGQEPVLLNPLDTFLPGTTVEVFYVQGGLLPGESYRTTVTLSRSGTDKELLSISFEELAGRRVESKRRGISLSDLEEGAYRLTLTIREVGSSRTVERHRTLNVIRP